MLQSAPMLNGGRGTLLLATISWVACSDEQSVPRLDRGEVPVEQATETAAVDNAAALSRLGQLREQFRPRPVLASPDGSRREAQHFLTPDRDVRLSLQGERVTAAFSPNRAATARISMPQTLRGKVRVEDVASAMALEFAPQGFDESRAVQLADGIARYALEGHSDVSEILQRALPSGVEDYVVFARRPALERTSYDLGLEAVAGLRLVGGSLELLDAQGTPRLRVAHPYLLDSDGGIHGAKLSLEGCAFDASPQAPWGRPVVPPGAQSCVVTVDWQGRNVIYPAVLDPTWTTTGQMSRWRIKLIAQSLPNGLALVAGGETDGSVAGTAELFDPATLTFAATGNMVEPRALAASVNLSTGKVLVVGGFKYGTLHASAELYDPASGTFVATGTMKHPRYTPTATALASGKVLVAGGSEGLFEQNPTEIAEVYDPQAELFAETGAMSRPRDYHAATLLDGETVLIAGGQGYGADSAEYTAEVWKESTGLFTDVGNMSNRRRFATAAAIPGGKALVYGDSSADLFDVATQTFSAIPAGAAGGWAVATVLSDKMVFLAGAGALFDPSIGKIVRTTNPSVALGAPGAALLPGDRVLVVGGYTNLATVWHKPLAGEECVSDSECAGGSCGGGFCCASACDTCSRCVEGSGACTPLEWGEDPHSCSLPMWCESGACKLFYGEPCGTDDSACAGGRCVDTVCCDSECGSGDLNDDLVCSSDAGAHADGRCSPKPGSACDDQNACTTGDVFVKDNGCRGEPTVCPQGVACNDTYCNADTGACDRYYPVADGTSCSAGLCKGGTCVSTGEGGAGGESTAGGNGHGGVGVGGEGSMTNAGYDQGGAAEGGSHAGTPGAAGQGVAGDAASLAGGGAGSGAPQGASGGIASEAGKPSDEEPTAGAPDQLPRSPQFSDGCGCAVVGARTEHGWLVALLGVMALLRRSVLRGARAR